MFRRKTVQGDGRWFPRPNDIIAYNLLNAMRDPSCPVCALVQRREDGFLFSLFWENVNSPHIRARLRQSLGFCDFHTQVLHTAVKKPWVGPFGVAILYRDFVDTVLERLRRRATVPERLLARNGARMQRRLSPSHRCWLCEMSDETEDTYLPTLAEGMDTSPNLRDRYSDSHGLCVLHAESAVSLTTAGNTQAVIVSTALRQLQDLSHTSVPMEDVGRFLLGYRSGVQATSLTRAIGTACPACDAEANAEQVSLRSMMPDDLLAGWRRLCPPHRRQAALTALRNGAAAGGFVEDIIQRSLSNEDESEKDYECPVCYQARQAAKDAIARVGGDLGLTGCLFHIRMLIGNGSSAQKESCMESLDARLGALSRELGELIRKHDYRFSHEPLGSEKDSWLRALAFFGSEKAPS